MQRPLPLATLACMFLALAPTGCNQLYYASMEKFGKEKRDILVKRIVQGKKDQQEAREQIKTTLEAFQEVTGFEGGDVERVYRKLNGEYEAARERVEDVSKQIGSVDRVANDMFREWGKEIGAIRDPNYRTRSRTLLREAQARHKRYMVTMRVTEKKMAPVLQTFQDQVLFLKHNLNARAIQSLKATTGKIDKQVEALIVDMEVSIKESDAFVQTLIAADS